MTIKDNRQQPLNTQPMSSSEAVTMQETTNTARGIVGVTPEEAPQYRYLTQGVLSYVTALGVPPVDR